MVGMPESWVENQLRWLLMKSSLMHIIQADFFGGRVISLNTRNLLKYVSQDYFNDMALIQFFSH